MLRWYVYTDTHRQRRALLSCWPALVTWVSFVLLNILTRDPSFKVTSAWYLSNMYQTVQVCVEGRGRISRSGLTQDIKMGSCVFQCDVPHQWIAQRQVGPVSVYCDGVGCRVLCLRHGISVWQHIGQSTTATRWHRRDMTSDVSKRR